MLHTNNFTVISMKWLTLALIILLILPVMVVAQMQEGRRESAETTLTATTNLPSIEENETDETIKLRERERIAWMEMKTTRSCKVDADCISIICPMVIGRDTPMCVGGICVCGPGRVPRYQVNETKIAICNEIRERIRNIVELIKEKKSETEVEELVRELTKLREENKDCFPSPVSPVPLIALESRIKKAQSVNEFLEEMKNLKEEMLNTITSQNLTGREVAQVIREYNEKRRELVKEFVQRIHEINLERMEEIKEVVVAKHVKWENETLFNVTKITVIVDGKNVTIQPGDNVTIVVEGVIVKSTIPLKVRNNTIEDAETNQSIRETPERVRARIREQVREMRLERKENKPVYVVAASKAGRLLGIIPVNVNVNYEISAIDGTTITVNRPWWSFLVFG